MGLENLLVLHARTCRLCADLSDAWALHFRPMGSDLPTSKAIALDGVLRQAWRLSRSAVPNRASARRVSVMPWCGQDGRQTSRQAALGYPPQEVTPGMISTPGSDLTRWCWNLMPSQPSGR